MSCMFRISGKTLDVDDLLSHIPLKSTQVYRRGEPVFPKSQPKGRKHKESGAGFLVSGADFNRFQVQKRDAIAFLRTKKAMVRRVMAWPGVDGGELDFGIEQREVIVQCEYFPAQLLKLAGSLGLDIEISLYPPFDEKKKRKRPTPSRTLRRVPRRK